MRTAFTFLIFLFLTATSFGQLPKKAMKKMGQNPILFLDSVETELSVLRTLNPFDISNINIIKPKRAKKFLGDKGVDGAIYIITVKKAKIAYWNYFSTKSEEYRNLLNSPQADTLIQYIVNGEVLSATAAPGTLFLITEKNFKSLGIIDKENLPSNNVVPYRYVVVITSKRIRGLVKKRSST